MKKYILLFLFCVPFIKESFANNLTISTPVYSNANKTITFNPSIELELNPNEFEHLKEITTEIRELIIL